MDIKKSVWLILGILLIDQVSKIYVKTHFQLGESIEVFSWFQIYFVENEGAAWGTKLSDIFPVSDKNGKLFLTIFRLFAIVGIGYWLWDTVRSGASKVLSIAVSLIFAGALGNIIDSVFYGTIFDGSRGQLATWFAEEPYGSLFHGKVVDMLYFPLVDTILPEWVPFWGGQHFSFFDPVFNIADSAISVGVVFLIIDFIWLKPKAEKTEFKTDTPVQE
ncbi:lipoprotein signal peptidase [Sediminicola luteus]|uniref:Lipoprotein signal peptidase n=1 Tax=Sediminicola luteus TaxID=319238 RepID=A0A2A4G2E0_9FLAO|nr:lipoprotein signal peptidase [Sediminicola luteus]PCE62847.1 lipoprotein signal peptidase [Sediminicola luteus]